MVGLKKLSFHQPKSYILSGFFKRFQFFPSFQNFLQVFKLTRFKVFLSLKGSLWLKAVLNSIPTLKRYSITTTDVVLNKKKLMMIKNV